MKRITAFFICAAMIVGMISGCGSAVPAGEDETAQTTMAATDPAEETKATEQTVPMETEMPVVLTNDFRIALITMDRIDQYWLDMEAGAMKAAEELGCEVINMSPVMKDDALQAEQIRKAVADSIDAIVVAAVDSDAVAAALKEAVDADVKIICVDKPAGAEADAVVCTDDKSAGRTAGETMIAELEEKGILEGSIGIIGIDPDSGVSVQRENGFREAFEGSGYTLPETQYSGGDAAKAHAIAEGYIDQGAIGIFCYTEGCTVGTGKAVKESGAEVVVVGFGETERITALLGDGHLSAVLVQNPDIMGYEGVKAGCNVLHGQNMGSAAIDTGVSVQTG